MVDEYKDNLNKTLNFLKQQLSRAAVDSRHELHHVYLTTVGAEYPEVRTVILRAVDWEKNSLSFHTDLRSKKYSELFQNSRASVLGYSHKKKFQIRLRGQIILNHKNEAAKKSWQRLNVSSRRCYLAASPGAYLPEAGNGLSELHNSVDLKIPATETGFDHFVSVTLIIQEIEWLLLDRQGHRRALFKFNEGQESPEDQTWLCP